MAQTKKKRRRKHRGTQGGSINRNRPRGRPRSREEARAQARRQVKQGSARDRPPSWRSATNRALVMAGILFVLMAFVLGREVASSAFLALTMLILYVPAGYYLERFLYNRRRAAEARKRQQAAGPRKR